MSILKVGMYASQFPTEQNYLTFSSDAPFSIKFNQISWDGVLEYSLDTENWYEWDASEISSVNNVIYLRGTGNSYITGSPAAGGQTSYAMQITATGDAECTGNIMSLLDHKDVDNVVMSGGAFASLFLGQGKLITSPELPATQLANYCYAHMLRETGIEVAPELPATVLAPYCYNYMFRDCINLTAAPELPSTTLALYCYAHMLRETGIEVAPELPATVLVEGCYSRMLYGTSIAISETQTGVYQTPWRIPSAGTIESEQANWNAFMLTNTNGTFTSNPDINTTYYQAD